MARVEAVFTLTDRMSRRLDAITKRSAVAELALDKLDKKIDRINRKINVLHLALAGLTARSINIRADMDIKPFLAKSAIVEATKVHLGNNLFQERSGGGIGTRGGGTTGSAIRLAANGLPLSQSSLAARMASRQGLANRGIASAFLANLGVTPPSLSARQRRLNASVFERPLRFVVRGPGSDFGPPQNFLGSEFDDIFDDSPSKTGGRRGPGFFRRALSFNRMDRYLNRNQNKPETKWDRFLKKQLAGGRGGYFRGASLIAVLAGSGLLSAGVGLTGGLGAGAAALGTGALAAGGLAGVLAAGAIPLATGAIKGAAAVKDAREAQQNAKTAEEYAAATAELAKAQAALTPVQRRLIADTERLKSVYNTLFTPIQGNIANIYHSIASTAQGLSGTVAGPIKGFGAMGQSLAKRGQNFFSNPREQELLGRFLNGLVPLSGQAVSALGKLAIVIERIAIAATPLATWIFSNINESLDGIINKTRGSGALTSWIEGFNKFKPLLSELGKLLSAMTHSLGRMFVDVLPFTVEFVIAVRQRLLPAIEEVIKVGAKVAGPAVLGLLGQILIFIKDSAGPLGTIIMVVARALEAVAWAINKINEVTGGVAGAALIFGGIGIASAIKVLNLIRAIRTGLFGVAAGQAAVNATGKTGLFSPLVEGGKLAITYMKRLRTALFGVAAAEQAVATAGMGAGASAAGGGILARLAGATGFTALAAGEASLLGASATVGGTLLAGYATASLISDQPGLHHGAGTYAGNFRNWLTRRNTGPKPVDLTNKGAGGGRGGLDVALGRGGRQQATQINFNAPININNGMDEKVFFEKLTRSVSGASVNMPHKEYNAGGIRIGG